MEEKHTQSQRLGDSKEVGPQTYMHVGYYVCNSQTGTVVPHSRRIWDYKN